MKYSEWKHLQKEMGCDKTCIYVDKKQINKGPCCTYYGKLDVDGQGKCHTKKTKEQREKEIAGR